MTLGACCALLMLLAAAAPGASAHPRAIGELVPAAIIAVGRTADWVVGTADAVWVGSTGPDAVHRIDPKTNQRVASVSLPGEPCAGLAVGFGFLWVPLCAATPALAKVDLAKNRLSEVLPVGPAGPEGGIASGAGGVWLIIDAQGTMLRIAPDGARAPALHLPPGSYNPLFKNGRIWVTRAEGAEITAVDAATHLAVASFKTGPNPRFLTAAGGAIWTLNQGDGTLTRIDTRSQRTRSIALATPGHGGDIASGGGMLWTTMPGMPLSAVSLRDFELKCQWAGPGGDSLTVAHGAIWLTNYRAGTLSRIALADALAHCKQGQ